MQRLYFLLKPWYVSLYRLIITGRKKLPDPEEHDRFWAFVCRIFKDRAALQEELGEKTYKTKTRGLRKLPPARPAAEGIYAIVRHVDHTHLAYLIELPKRHGEKIEKPKERAPATVINSMNALRKSVAAERRDSRGDTWRAATYRPRAVANRSRLRIRKAS